MPIIPTDLSNGTQEQKINIPSVANPSTYNNKEEDFSSVFGNLFASNNKNTSFDPILTPKSETERYPSYNPLVNNEELYAQNQSWYSKIGNDLVKTGAIAVGTFAQGLMSTADILRASTNTFGGNVYKNSWSQAIDDFKDNIENKFPNYFTQDEIDHPLALRNTVFDANFWGDKVIKNLGFTAGAIGSAMVQDLAVGAATEGLGEIPLVSEQIGKASLYLNKILSSKRGVEALEAVKNVANVTGEGEQALSTFKTLQNVAEGNRILNGARYTTNILGAANAEAGIEARDGYNNVKKDLINSYKEQNGYNPVGEDLAEIEKTATASGNVRYGINMALLAASDAIQFDAMFKPFNSLKNSISKGLEAKVAEQEGKIGLKEETIKVAKDIDNLELKKASKLSILQNIIPNILAEGVFEEGGQYAAERGTKQYFEDKYNKKTKGDLNDIINSTIYGLGEQFGTTEGLENMILGGLTGAIFGAVEPHAEAFKQKKAELYTRKEATAKAVEELNKRSITGIFQDNYDTAASTIKRQQDLKEAVTKNDIYKFQNLKEDSFMDFIMSGIKAGRFEVRLEQLKLLKDLSNEEINKLFGIEGNQRDNHLYIDKLIENAETIKRSHDAISNTIRNLYSYNKNDEKNAYLAFEEYKSALTTFSYKAKNYTNRLSDIQNTVSSKYPLLTNEILSSVTNKNSLKDLSIKYQREANELQKQIDNGDKTVNTKDITRLRNLSQSIIDIRDKNGTFNEQKYINLLPELINKEVGSDLNISKEDLIDTEKGLIKAGYDINQINHAKYVASQVYDHLFSQEGYEDFIQNYQEWRDSLSAEDKEEIKSEETITVGDRSYNIGDTYKSNKDFEYKLSKNNGVYEIKNPFNEVESGKTYNNEDDAAKEVNNLNKEIRSKDIIEILGKNENGQINIKDKEGNVHSIDPRYLNSYERVFTKYEEFKEDKKTSLKIKKIFNDNGIVTDNNILAEKEYIGAKKKLSIIANTGTEPRWEITNHDDITYSNGHTQKGQSYAYKYLTEDSNPDNLPHRRNQRFLYRLDRDPKLEHLKETLRVLVVNSKNESDLGLQGIIDPSYKDNSIRYVYVEKDGDKYHFIDEQGTRLETPDLKKIVFTNAPLDLKFDTNEGKEESYINDIKDEEGKLIDPSIIEKQWQRKRNILLNFDASKSEATLLKISGISNGLLQIKDSSTKNNIIETGIISKKDLNEPVISIETYEHKAIHKGEGNVIMPKGKPYLNFNNTILFLNSRNLSEQEARNTYQSLSTVVERLIDGKDIDDNDIQKNLTYLKGIVRLSLEDKIINRNAVNIDSQNFTVQIGENTPIPFDQITNNRALIINQLQDVYHHVNNSYLIKFKKNPLDSPFYELNNSGESKKWKSYQHYLLENRAGIAPLTTNSIIPQNKEIPLIQKYPILDTSIIEEQTVPVPTKEYIRQQIAEQLKPQKKEIVSTSSDEKVKEEEARKRAIETLGLVNKPLKKEKPNISPELRTITNPITLIGNKQEEEQEVRRMLPNINIEHLKNIITTTGGLKAYGQALPNFISVWKEAPYGVKYHEAFEQVFNYILLPHQQQDLVNEFNTRTGTFTTFEGIQKNYKDASFKEAKEKIADEFAEYKTTGEIPYPKPKISGFFKKLLALIKQLVLGNPNTIGEVFNKLNKGKYSNSIILTPVKVEPQYKQHVEDTPVKLFQDTLYGMTAQMFTRKWSEDANIINDIEEEKGEISKDIFDKLYNDLDYYFSNREENNPIMTLYRYMSNKVYLDPAAEQTLQKEYEQVLNNWNNIKNQWANYVEDCKQFLKVFDIAFVTNDEGEIEINPEIEDAAEERPQVDYFSDDKMYASPKNNASTAVKILFATIPNSEFVKFTTDSFTNWISRDKNEMKLPTLAQYAKLFNYTLHNSANINGIIDIVDHLKDVVSNKKIQQNANLERLINRLGFSGSFEGMPESSIKLILKLENALTKQKPIYNKQYVLEDGSTVQLTSNISNRAQQLKEEWLDNLKSLKFTKVVNDKLVFTKDIISPDRITQLNNIGIPLTKEQYDTLKSYESYELNTAVNKLRKNLEQYIGQVLPNTLTSASSDIGNNMSKIAEIYAQKFEGDTTESQHVNPEGKMTGNFGLNNYISYILNDANNSKSKDEFIAKNPQYNDIFMSSSKIMNDMLYEEDGRKSDFKLNLYILEGRDSTKDEANPTHKMSYGERLLYEINNNFSSIYYTLVPADTTREYGLFIKDAIKKDFFTGREKEETDKFLNYMIDNLRTEINLARDYSTNTVRANIDILSKEVNGRKIGESLRFFKLLPKNLIERVNNIIDSGEELSEEDIIDIKSAVVDFISSRAQKTIKSLEDYELIVKNDITGKYNLFGFLENFITDSSRKNWKWNKNISVDRLNQIFFFRTANYVAANIEMHKFLFNDPAQYKDSLKRPKSFISGREYTHNSAKSDLNSALNKIHNKVGDYNLKSTDHGYYLYRDNFNSLTLNKISTVSKNIEEYKEALGKKFKGYDKNDIADAQSWVTGNTYREMMYKSGGRWTNNQNDLHNWLMAYERKSYLDRKWITEEQYPKALQNEDSKILEKDIPYEDKNNKRITLPTIKPIISGVGTNNNTAIQYLYKTSTAPLYFYFVEGTPMEAIYKNMQDKGVDFLAMESAHKVGQLTNNLSTLYNEGKIENFSNKELFPIDYKYFGIQVETQGTKDYQTQGSQLTKLAVQDLMSNGIPIDFIALNNKLSIEQIDQKWKDASEEEKQKSNIYNLVKNHNQALIELTIARSKKLFNKLDIKKGQFGYVIEDKRKVAEFLLSELERREMPYNMAEGLDIENNQFKNPIESNSNYKKIKQILYSTIQNNLTKPKVSGGPKILLSAAGFDNLKEEIINGKKVLTSSTLEFYTNKDSKTQACQIAIPFIFGDKLIKQLEKKRGESFKNNKEGYEYVRQYLNNTEEGKELLRGIGFRIPTQGLNSVDYFEVAQFLPPQMGDVVIFPSEITTKAGSDFDVDKMNMYLKNWYIDSKTGMPKLIPFFGYGEEAESKLSFIVKKSLSAKEDKNTIDNLTSDSIDEDTNAIYIKSLENRYYSTIQDILSSKDTFSRLITPNDAGQMKKISSEIKTLRNAGEENYSNTDYQRLLDNNFMSKERDEYLSSKQDVGIAAISNTNLAVNQLSNTLLVIPTDRNFKIRFSNYNSFNNLLNVSGISNSSKDLLSDIGSQIIDGTVDAVNDKWLSELLNGKRILNVYNLLIKVGIDPKEAGLFINQPSIQEYLRKRDISQNMSSIKTTIKKEPIWTTRDKIFTTLGVRISKKDKSTKGITKVLNTKSNIYDFDKLKSFIGKDIKSLSEEDKIYQAQLLDDYYIWSKIASKLFKFVKATTYDTTNYTSPESVVSKNLQYQDASKDNNIIGLSRVMSNTHIGQIKDSIQNTNEGLSSIFSTQKGIAKYNLEKSAIRLNQHLIGGDNIDKYQSKAESSLIEYIIQTQTIDSDYINNLMLSKYSIANYIEAAKNNPALENNIILKNIKPVIDKREGYPSYLELIEKENDSYTSNIWTEAFKELRDSGESVTVEGNSLSMNSVYKLMVIQQILQNGISRNKYTFLHLLPNEDFAAITKPVLSSIKGNIDFWFKEGLFYRNNWNDNTLITEAPREETVTKQDSNGNTIHYNDGTPITEQVIKKLKSSKFQEYITNNGYNLSKQEFPILDSFTNQNKPFVKQTSYERDTNGKITNKKVVLYKRVETVDENGILQPINIKIGNATFAIFKKANKLGNTILKEYNTDTLHSKLVENENIDEIPDEVIINALNNASIDTNISIIDNLIPESDFTEEEENLNNPENSSTLENNNIISPEGKPPIDLTNQNNCE